MSEFDTWYVLEDGNIGDPMDIAPGDDGKLAHKDGRRVAYRDDGITPRSRGCVDAGAERAKAADQPSPAKAPAEAKDIKPEGDDLVPAAPKRGYKTRETKAASDE